MTKQESHQFYSGKSSFYKHCLPIPSHQNTYMYELLVCTTWSRVAGVVIEIGRRAYAVESLNEVNANGAKKSMVCTV